MTTTSDPAAYFGRQVRKERAARGWNLHDFGQLIAYHPAAISRVETGKRPPTESFADQCDRVFPERAGWFHEFFEESRGWMALPAWLRDWASPSRLARQQRVLLREEPPAAWFLVDHFALLRQIGAPDVMAAQMRHLSALACLPHVMIQVVPGTAHAGLLGGFTVTDKAAYAESVMRGQVFEDEETHSALSLRFDTLRGSACSAPESIKLLRQAADLWSGARQPTARKTGTA